MLEQFLKQFYQILSFEKGEPFKDDAFSSLFLDNAVLIEKVDGVYKQKSVEEHVAEFHDAIKNYPALFERGFHEEQTDFSAIKNETCCLVSSQYTKTYSRQGELYSENGINNMVIVKCGDCFKIASVLW